MPGKRLCRPSPSDDKVFDVGGCSGRKNDDVSPPSAFLIPANGGNVGGNAGGSGNNKGSDNGGCSGDGNSKSVSISNAAIAVTFATAATAAATIVVA